MQSPMSILMVSVPPDEKERKTKRSSEIPRNLTPPHPLSPHHSAHKYGNTTTRKVMISPRPHSISRNSSNGTTGTSSDGTRSSRTSAKTTIRTNHSSDNHSHASSHLTNHTTKTASSTQRKARLPKMLKFKKKKSGETKKSKSKKKSGKDYDSDSSSLSPTSKTALLSEFSTLMNEFPTEDTLNTTLHVACVKKYSEALIVDQLISKGPSAVTMRNQNRDLPLHCAMKCTIDNGVDDRVFDELVTRYPVGVEAVNKDNCLPLHLACKSGGRNVNVTKKLLELYPLGAIMKCDLKLQFDDEALDFVERNPDFPRLELDKSISEDTDDMDTCGSTFWSTFLMLSPKNSFEIETNIKPISSNPGIESGFSPLHLAVMFGAPPDIIEAIITANPACLALTTDQGRKAIDIARYAVAGKKNQRPANLSILRMPSHDDDEDELRINRYINNIDEDPAQNIFAAIEIIKTFDANRQKSMRLANATTMTANSMRELGTIEEFDGNEQWRKLGNLIKIAGAFKRPPNALGSVDPFDANKAVRPEGYKIPSHLNHVCVDIKIPVGYRRLRWALLNNLSDFGPVEVLQNKLKYSEVQTEPWDKHNEQIGALSATSTEDASTFIGAQRKCQYLMPKSGMVGANTAYETHTIEEYSDYAFVTRKVVTNPEVPFGKTFYCIVQTIIYNLGYNNCRMFASVEAEFIGRPPMVAWKIKNAMYNGVTDFFVAQGETICEHAFREGSAVEAEA